MESSSAQPSRVADNTDPQLHRAVLSSESTLQHCSPPDTPHAPKAQIPVQYDAVLPQTRPEGVNLWLNLQQKHGLLGEASEALARPRVQALGLVLGRAHMAESHPPGNLGSKLVGLLLRR